MSLRLRQTPDRGLNIRIVWPKYGRMATLHWWGADRIPWGLWGCISEGERQWDKYWSFSCMNIFKTLHVWKTHIEHDRVENVWKSEACQKPEVKPCMPVGPKPCRVKKMAWSWCSECSGSSFCWMTAQRHTFSRLREGLPPSMRLMDWEKD